MTLVSFIITQAYRESNLVMLGAEPRDAQKTEAFALLRSMVESVYGGDVGENLQDWMVGTSGVTYPNFWSELQWKYPIQNSRLLLNHQTPQTLYWPPAPDNGARMRVVDLKNALAAYPITIQPEGHLIEGAATLVLNTNGLNRAWIFDSHSSNWARMEEITLEGEMPFPTKFDDYFMIKLASRLNPRYGRSLSDLSITRLQEQEEELAADYRQRRNMPAPLAVRRLTDPRNRFHNTARRGRWGWM